MESINTVRFLWALNFSSYFYVVVVHRLNKYKETSRATSKFNIQNSIYSSNYLMAKLEI